MAGLSLKKLALDFPDIEIEKVEFLTNRKRAKNDGVGSVPALVSGDKKLSSFLMTKKQIKQFLESL